jgi:serine/threonine protein kinase
MPTATSATIAASGGTLPANRKLGVAALKCAGRRVNTKKARKTKKTDRGCDSDSSSDDGFSDSDSDNNRRKRKFFRPRRVAGTKVGSYRLIKFMAHGGFANVYAAAPAAKGNTKGNGGGGAEVAIKVFRQDEPDTLETEMALMRSLHSPNVVPILSEGEFTVDRNRRFSYCVLPKYDMDLKTLLKHVALTDEEVRTVMVQAATGVLAVHETGWLHYDLKPENMLVNYDVATRRFQRLVVSDLGSAIRPNAKGPPPDWGFSLSYAAPEQLARCRACTDFGTDIFALGCIFYELMCGNTLFLKSHDDKVYHMAEIRALNPYYDFPSEMKGSRKLFNAHGHLKYNALRIMMPKQWLRNCADQVATFKTNPNYDNFRFVQKCCHPDQRCRPSLSDLLEHFAPPKRDVMSLDAIADELDDAVATADARAHMNGSPDHGIATAPAPAPAPAPATATAPATAPATATATATATAANTVSVDE